MVSRFVHVANQEVDNISEVTSVYVITHYIHSISPIMLFHMLSPKLIFMRYCDSVVKGNELHGYLSSAHMCAVLGL